jgi:DNA recombination protein RmuC
MNEGHKEDDVLTKWLTEMKGSVDKIPNEIERHLKDQKDTLDRQTKLIWERLDASSEVVRAVQKQLGGLQEFGTDMKDLSNILKSPKLRGGLGEQFLYEILENFLPKDLFKTQYKFKNGDTCDAAVFTDKGIIPIDSKFPMENFKAMLTAQTQEERDRFKKVFSSDVKKRIDEISSKYILPEEGTTGQAIMYIPSENVYYELIVNTPEIEDYCHKKNIIMASPNTLSYFLKVLLVAYQQHELEKHAGEILKALGGIKIEAEKFNEDLGVLERHITNSYKSMDGVKNRFGKLFGKIESVQSIEEPEQKKLLE